MPARRPCIAPCLHSRGRAAAAVACCCCCAAATGSRCSPGLAAPKRARTLLLRPAAAVRQAGSPCRHRPSAGLYGRATSEPAMRAVRGADRAAPTTPVRLPALHPHLHSCWPADAAASAAAAHACPHHPLTAACVPAEASALQEGRRRSGQAGAAAAGAESAEPAPCSPLGSDAACCWAGRGSSSQQRDLHLLRALLGPPGALPARLRRRVLPGLPYNQSDCHAALSARCGARCAERAVRLVAGSLWLHARA